MNTNKALTTRGATLAQIGVIADQVAASHILEDYQARRTEETKRRQHFDLVTWSRYLQDVSYTPGDLENDLSAWSGVTSGLVDGFVKWSVKSGYALGTVNVRLATIRVYCAMASRAGHIPASELTLIQTVKGYRSKEARTVNEGRDQTRKPGAKKAESIVLTPALAAELKRAAMKTRSSARDVFIVCLFVDMAMRCEEVANLDIEDFDLEQVTVTFTRHKTDTTSTLELTPDTLISAQNYLATLEATRRAGPLFSGIAHKRDVKYDKSARRMEEERMAERTIGHLIARLGKVIGRPGLSPHDLRHYWATDAARNGNSVDKLQGTMGHSSSAMSLRYVERAKIANKNVKLSASSVLS